MTIEQLKKHAHRLVRYNGIVERAQQIVRMSPKLTLQQIGLQLDIRPDDIMIDCGANVGDVTSSFARTGAQVYAFEPNPLCFSILRRRFAMTPNVKCFNQGVMDRECTLTYSTAKPHGKWDYLDVTITGSFKGVGNLEKDTTEVQCVNLSDFIFSIGRNIRLLKVDIEGSEVEVLNNLLDTKAIDSIDLILVETHEMYFPALLKGTEELRMRIEDQGLSPKFRLDWP
jgi:FkbM family methyltransferase